MKPIMSFVALVTAITATHAAAHHNAGLIFDLEQNVTAQGVVTRFSPGNPHARVYFTRVDGVGEAGEEWMAEGGSRTVLLRRDWTSDMLKPGDAITLIGHPSRDNSNVIHMEWISIPDGRTLWAEDVPAPERVGELVGRSAAQSE